MWETRVLCYALNHSRKYVFVYYDPSASIAKLTFKHRIFILYNQQLSPCLVETDNSKGVQEYLHNYTYKGQVCPHSLEIDPCEQEHL